MDRESYSTAGLKNQFFAHTLKRCATQNQDLARTRNPNLARTQDPADAASS